LRFVGFAVNDCQLNVQIRVLFAKIVVPAKTPSTFDLSEVMLILPRSSNDRFSVSLFET